MNKLRIVIDVNVIVSALLFYNSSPRKALDIIKESHQILMSESIFSELENVLNRPKFNKYITLGERQEFLREFKEKLLFVVVTEIIEDCRDAKDNKYLELALSGLANCIVTGDQDLLVLHPWREVKIITVQTFLDNHEEI